MHRYFDFHRAPKAENISAETHGVVPVWGFGIVVMSTHPRILTGERVYGYLAPARYLILPVSSSDVNKHAFYVPRPHLPAGMIYVRYYPHHSTSSRPPPLQPTLTLCL
jgi:hypothetical protein